MTLAPLDSNQRTYDVFMGGDQVSYQSAFNYLFKLSLNLNEITLARFLYKALYQKELDADVLNHLKTLGIDTLKVEAHLWAWVVHITLCREQVVPGTWIRVMRLLEFATQQQDGHCSLLDVEDDEHKMRRLRLVQILDPQSAVFAALSRQDTERGKLLSSLPKLKQEYDAFTEKMLHCTCEVSGDPVLRAARSPQPKKEVKCSEFTLQLSAQLKNDPRYLAERDLIPRQEFESIKRYGVDNIDQIRMLPDGHAKKQRMQEALEETQAHLESIMQDYLSYKDLRGKEIKEKTLNKNENYQLLKHAKNIAMDQEKKINEVYCQ